MEVHCDETAIQAFDYASIDRINTVYGFPAVSRSVTAILLNNCATDMVALTIHPRFGVVVSDSREWHLDDSWLTRMTTLNCQTTYFTRAQNETVEEDRIDGTAFCSDSAAKNADIICSLV